MALSYDIDVASRLVVLTCGDVTLERWRRTMGQVVADPRFRIGFGVLVDCRTATLAPETQDVVGVVDFLANRRARLGLSRWAVVVEEPAGYGMARMTAAIAESAGLELRAFRTMDEALEWLGEGVVSEVRSAAGVSI
jgi:hypothetical protein